MIDTFLKAIRLLNSENRRRLILLIGFMLSVSLLEIVGIGLIFPLIRLVGEPEKVHDYAILDSLRELAGVNSDLVLVMILVFAFGAFILFKNVFMFLAVVWQNWYMWNCEMEVSRRLFNIYLTSDYQLHLTRNSAELIRNVTDCMSGLYRGVMTYVIRALSEIVIAISIVAILFVAQPWAASVAVAFMGAGAGIFYYLLKDRFVAWGREKHERRRDRLQCLQQSLNGIKEIKIHNKEEFFTTIFDNAQRAMMRVQIKAEALGELPRLSFEVLMIWTVIALIFLSLAQNQGSMETMAVLGLFAGAGFRLMPSFSRLIAAITIIRQSIPSVAYVDDDFIAFHSRVPSGAYTEPVAPVEFKSLRLENVSFRYPNEERVSLHNINLEIRRGDSIALVGASGAGKSTLVDIILGLYRPSQGRILLNGNPLREDLRPWQQNIGFVPQSMYIFDDTLRRNIAMGEPDDRINEDSLRNAIRLAQIEDLVGSMKDGADTVLGEHGTRLSGGQRQRVGIARALYRSPQLLILDEATSALDRETEKAITKAIHILGRERTLIVIAHRMSTVQHCRTLFFLKEGRIADSGSFEELSRRNADFRRMVDLAEREHE